MEKINTRRKLRPLKLGRRSKDFFVFDTETGTIDENGNIKYFLSARPEHLIFGVIYGTEKGKPFKKVIYGAEEFKKEFLKKRYKNKLIFAHNAEYDLSAVYGNIYLMDGNAVFNGKFITACNYLPNPKFNKKLPIDKNNRPLIPHAKFADSFNLLPTSVEKLGKLLGVEKKKLGDASLNSHKNRLHLDIDYCATDCEIVYKSLKKMFEKTEPSFTIGSHAVKVFRSQYLKKEIIVDGLADEFFNCMYGGRTEAFKIGKCKGHVYDINSAYPRAMLNQLPDPSRLKVVDGKDAKIYLRDELYGGMVTATVEISEHEKLPALPVKWEGKLLFPTGVLTGSWTFPEFKNAMFNTEMKVLNIERAVVSPLIASPFTPFIQTHFAKRQATNDEFLRLQYKLEMNNVYGKLVQRLREEYKFFQTFEEIYQHMRNTEMRRAEVSKVVGGYFIRYDVDKIYAHTIPCFGAYITSYVRVMLHEMMNAHLDNLLYCDTDSVVLSKELDLDEKFLGGWKREQKLINNIRTLKDYTYVEYDEKEELWKHGRSLKGVKKNATQLTKDADIFQYERMVKTRESMRRKDNLPPGTFIQQIKLLTGDYNKRIVLPDGSTKPFNF